MDLIVTTAEVADFFGITIRAVQLWSKNLGCPKAGHGKWNLKEVFDWWFLNLAQDKIANGDGDETLQTAKRMYWSAKAEGERIKVEQVKESLFPREEIAKAWAGRMAEVANGLSSLSMRLSPLLEGKIQSEMRGIIENETWKLRDNYCRVGKFCHPDQPKSLKKKPAKRIKKPRGKGKKK